MNKLKEFRYCQAEADDAIYQELITANKCIVKKFCGTGKSLLMRKCKSVKNQKLVVYVFPSLSLIDQFCNEYFINVGFDNPFKISSENDSTTDSALIKSELKKKENKIICVTYQSYKTLLDNLGSIKIDVCIYDEAHHAVAPTYQKLIFERNDCEKQIFFTATPKDDNGIVMCDKEIGICGRTVYDYSYLQGLRDGYLNPFEIHVDMYTENTNKSVYESIARAILVSGNNRVLTFHADVNTERDSSVINFVKEHEFIRAFQKVLIEEFPKKEGLYTKFKMIALDASIKMDKRQAILVKFDTTLDNEVYIISSCETIGEGIDTKNANMCVFVDPKSSFVKIIQNIGRIVRPQSKPSTVLIPCWVDKTKYVGCDEDREKCDEVIRSDLNKDGNFNGILNVLSALRQEDPDLYDICLHYPDIYSLQEIRSNLEKHRYKMLDQVGDGELLETMEYLLDDDIDYDDYEDCDTNEEMIMRIAEDNDVCVEIHTNSFENQIEKYNSECESGEIIRLYKEEYDEDDEGNQVYCPIIKKCGKRRGNGSIKGLDRKDRIKIDVHTNLDVKVLWKLVGDFTKEICSCVLECDVVEYDPMEVAIAIVSRKTQRPCLLPRHIGNKKNRKTPELEQEHKDAQKLSGWKNVLKGWKGKCSDEVCNYLDKELGGWRNKIDFDEKAIEDAKAIVSRKSQRPNLLPRIIGNKINRKTPELEQEHKDASKLSNWKTSLKGIYHKKCPDKVCDYLDKELEGWRIEADKKALSAAKKIVSRKTQRPNLLPRKLSKQNQKTLDLVQENKDAQKLGQWKKTSLSIIEGYKSPNIVRDYLDKELEGWCNDLDENAIEYAKAIVLRKIQRPNLLPRNICNKQTQNTPELEQEHKDAQKLGQWKKGLSNKTGGHNCPNKVRDYLDIYLEGWRDEPYEKILENVINIIERANERFKNNGKLLPRQIPKENQNTPELIQESKDASNLRNYKQRALKKGSDKVCDYLDIHLQGWRTELDEKAMEFAKQIVKRANDRFKNNGKLLPRQIPKENQNTLELIQESKDASKISGWKQALNGNGTTKCPDEVCDYLDKELIGWRTIDESEIQKSKKTMKIKTTTIKNETSEKKRERVKSEISILHQRYKTLKSENLYVEFNQHPELWNVYHNISEENERSFPEESIPRNRIIQELNKIKTKRTRLIVDMGCGKGQISQHFANDPRFQFINYDHISSNNTIISCDISKTPLEENMVEICILSLAMWGSNCKEYVKETNRILESGGKLYIIEPTKRWSEQDEYGNIIPYKEGNKMKVLLEESGFKIVEQSIEKFCMFICIKI
jgi:ribosomal RNA-processing protein 8